MTTFDLIHVPQMGVAEPDHSLDEIQTMESRMEAHILTISNLISERESAWEEFDSLDVR